MFSCKIFGAILDSVGAKWLAKLLNFVGLVAIFNFISVSNHSNQGHRVGEGGGRAVAFYTCHSIGNGQQHHSIEICVSTHIALRISLPLRQPVNCIFWPIRTLNWLMAAIELHNNRAPCPLLIGPTVYFLYCVRALDV